MGGWGTGIRTRQLGTNKPLDIVWVGYRDSSKGKETTLSLECDGEEQHWTGMDIDSWKELVKEIEIAIKFLEEEEEEDRPSE